ncbi:nucleotidyltransferase domain-containing protein [Streptomyces sp. NPDC101132]|uniref:nucleotidyltransferase domain-containing protein n=1 Tax=Streptomyces sp. NPDC101132 TaxID=3366110 RepID=UPI003808BD43
MERKGLDERGFIEREGALGNVGPDFRAVVAAARTAAARTYGRRLHSAYLYGSVPRGTARPGRSDLDLLLALHEEPTAADREDAARLGRELDREHPEIDGAGVLLFGKETLLGEAERYDMGWFVACLCTPLLGDDLAEHLPRYRPDGLLARETNGDLAERLPVWRARAGRAEGPAERRALVRAYARKLVRTGFTLVMPRWGGWTSELDRSAEIFGRYYPERARQMREAAALALEPVADPAVLRAFTEDLGPWLAAEYAAVVGTKARRSPVATAR